MSLFKILSRLSATALLITSTISATAQQLPNNGFEGKWSTCTPWTGGHGTVTIGQNPENWCISHVMGITTKDLVAAGTGKKEMGIMTDGYNSNNAVKVFNDETGALSINRVVPGYLTLGTTWSTAKGATSSTHDGGTWGGTSFTNRPDGVSFYYQRGYNGSDHTENASFIAYLWKGTWTQANVPVTITAMSNPKTTTMTNRDRCVLGGTYATYTTGGNVTPDADAELIASVVEIEAKEVTDWTQKVIQFKYDSKSAPTMLNVIFSANEYFNTKSATKGNSLSIDDVKLVYYSRLSGIKYTLNGESVAVPDFESTTEDYEISVDALPTAITPEVLSPSGSSTATVTESRSVKEVVYSIKVTNSNGSNTGFEDIDGKTEHTYTVTFKRVSLDLSKIVIGEKEFEPDVTNIKLPFTTDIKIKALVNGEEQLLTPVIESFTDNNKPGVKLIVSHPEDTNLKKELSFTFLPYKAELIAVKIEGKEYKPTGTSITIDIPWKEGMTVEPIVNMDCSGKPTASFDSETKKITVTNENISKTYTLVFKTITLDLITITIGGNDFVPEDGNAFANDAIIATNLPFTTDLTIETDGTVNPIINSIVRGGDNNEPTAKLTISHPDDSETIRNYSLTFLPFEARISEVILPKGSPLTVTKDDGDIAVGEKYSDDLLPASVTTDPNISGAVKITKVEKPEDINYPKVIVTVENADANPVLTKNYTLVYDSPTSSRISGVTINGTTYPVDEDGKTIDLTKIGLMPAAIDIKPVFILPDEAHQKATITLDTETGEGTITVKNTEGKDYDGSDTHNYTLKFDSVDLSRPKKITIKNKAGDTALRLTPAFDSKTYSYRVNGGLYPEIINDKLEYEWFNNKELNVETTIEGDPFEEAPKLIVAVSNPNGGTDYDGLSSHTYTFTFNKRTIQNRSVSLKSLSIGGVAVPGFDSEVKEYNIDRPVIESENELAYEILEYGDNTADGTKVEVTIDKNSATVTLLVSNEISNSDDENEREYILHFLPYYSRIETIGEVNLFEETGAEAIKATVSGQMPGNIADLEATLKFPEKSAGKIEYEINLNADAATATIKVSNSKPDVDGISSRTYTIKYDAPFFSRLESLIIGGVAVPGFNRNTFSYTIDAQMPTNPTITPTVIKGSNAEGKAEIKEKSANAEKALVKVVVTNVQPDVDGESTHTYTVQYALPYFSRLVSLTIGGTEVSDLPQDGKTPVNFNGQLPDTDEEVLKLFGYQFKDGSGNPAAAAVINRSKYCVEITVTNGGQKDIDGKTSHKYIVQFSLPYFSTASSIMIEDEAIEEFESGVFEYTVAGQMPEADKITVNLNQGSGTSDYKVTTDKETATATITITNPGDDNGSYSSTTKYVLHFDLPYFSRLASLTVRGVEVEEFDKDKFEYTLSGMLPEEDEIVATAMNGSGTASVKVTRDIPEGKAIVTVTNSAGVDIDGKRTHTYTLYFDKPVNSRLSSISINGTPVAGFDTNTFDYDLTAIDMPENGAVTAQSNNPDAEIAIDYDTDNCVVTITVTADRQDEDGLSSHTYTLTFKKPVIVNSRLSSITVAGTPVAGFDTNTFTYNLSTTEMPAQGEVSATSINPDAVIDIRYDKSKSVVTITVTAEGNDEDGLSSHTYTLTFKEPVIVNSRLSSITVAGTPVPGFDTSTFSYNLSTTEMPAQGEVTATSINPDAVIDIRYDKSKSVVTIAVTAEGNDEDGLSSHTYTLTFKKPEAPKPTEGKTIEYTGTLNIYMMGEDITGGGQEAKVEIKENNDGTCTFSLPNFSLDLGEGPVSLGDIVVENVTMTPDGNGGYTYSGDVKGMELAEGSIVADVTLTGTTDAEGKAAMKILVLWEGIEIDVDFNGVKTAESGNPTPGPAPEGKSIEYTGTLNIYMMGEDITGGGQEAKVEIKENNDGTCTFSLPNFSLDLGDGPVSLGNIVVENVTMTPDGNGGYTYSGDVKGMELAEGSIVADVTLTGTTDAEGKAAMKILVLWEGIEIDVDFNGVKTAETGNPTPGPTPEEKWIDFDGELSIEMGGSYIAENQKATVYITEAVDGKCTFKLPDFSIDLEGTVLTLGDIVVEDVQVEEENGETKYSGFVPDMEFLDGEIVADINLNGTVDAAGNAVMTIQVMWKASADESIPINVEFNGKRNSINWLTIAGTLTVALDGYDITEGGQEAVVKIAQTGEDGLYTFLLPDFSIALDASSEPAVLGDIMVDGIKMTPAEGYDRYTGKVDRMELANGDIVAGVKVDGTITTADEVRINVDVVWYMDDNRRVPILVKFINTTETPVTPERAVYKGTLTTETENSVKEHNVRIHMTPSYGNRSDLLIEGIDLAGSRAAAIGNSVSVPSVSINSLSNGYKAYDGAATAVQVQPGMTLDINLHGYSDLADKFTLLMDIEWIEEGIRITGSFSGVADATGIDPVFGDDNSNAPVEYFNLNGVRVNGDNLTPGIYIRRQGNKSEKIIVK